MISRRLEGQLKHRIEVEDLVQEVTVVALQSMRKFEWRNETPQRFEIDCLWGLVPTSLDGEPSRPYMDLKKGSHPLRRRFRGPSVATLGPWRGRISVVKCHP